MSNDNLQLIIPLNLAVKLARELRRRRIHFKRLRRGNYQLVRRVYSKDELKVFSQFWPIEQIEILAWEDVTIVETASESLIVVDKEKLRESAEAFTQQYLETHWKRQQQALFESIDKHNEQLSRQNSILFRSSYFYGTNEDKSISALWGNTIY